MHAQASAWRGLQRQRSTIEIDEIADDGEPEAGAGLSLIGANAPLENAVPHCNMLLAQDGLNPVVHFYHALLLEQMERRAEAERSLRQAIHLDRNFLLAHYHLGLALARGNQPRLAARSFENVVRLSGSTRDQQTVENGDGLTVAGLKQMAQMRLQNLGVS